METFNQSLFLWINAAPGAPAWLLGLAHAFAVYLVWLLPVAFLVGWRSSDWRARRGLLIAVAAAVLGWLLAHAIGAVWPHPRPFVLGLGTNALPHAPSNSFPSNHLTFVWSVASALLLQTRWRKAGAGLALLGVPVAWARIYLGVHFPLDMAGALAVGLCAAVVSHRYQAWLITPWLQALAHWHRRVLREPIRRGWLRR